MEKSKEDEKMATFPLIYEAKSFILIKWKNATNERIETDGLK